MPTHPFVIDKIYKRRAIHDKYGGNRQSGICPSKDFPFIFIFYGSSGEQHGYHDGWDNENMFTYTGHGQKGDMEFVSGNLAIREHKANNKRLLVFESLTKGFVKFVGEVELYNVDFFETPDTYGTMRTAIKFFLKRVGYIIPESVSNFLRDGLSDYSSIERLKSTPNKTERTGLVTSRVGQGMYRKRIIHRWEYKCAVTGFNNLNILIASHIVPWSKSDNHERIDVNNGLLLSPTYDALFDQHLITFETDGKIVLSDSIEQTNYDRIGVTGDERIQKLVPKNLSYLERHQMEFEKRNEQRRPGSIVI